MKTIKLKNLKPMKVQDLLNLLTEAAGQGGSQKEIYIYCDGSKERDPETFAITFDIERIYSDHPKKVTIIIA